MSASSFNTAARDSIGRELGRHIVGATVAFPLVAFDFGVGTAVGHEHGAGAAGALCGSSDATALATHLTETLTLESLGFARNVLSSGELEALHFIGIRSFGEEFREDVVFRGIQEKFRKPLAKRGCDDEFGIPGRTVRSQDPKEAQTSRGCATERYCSNPWQMRPVWMKT